MNLNSQRPDWIPSLKFSSVGLHMADAFSKKVAGFDPDVEFAACQAWFIKNRGMSEEEAYEQARFKMRDLVRQKQRVWEVYNRAKLNHDKKEDMRHADMWINQLEDETTEKTNTTRNPSPARINLFNTARKELLDKHDIRMKLATSVKKRLEVTDKLKAEIVSDRLSMEAADSNPPGKRWKDMKKHEQEEFIREQLIHNTKYSSRHKYIYDRVAERELQLTRFVEYCDVVGRNPSIEGVKDPTDYLLSVDEKYRRALLLEMSQKLLPSNYDKEQLKDKFKNIRKRKAEFSRVEPLSLPSSFRDLGRNEGQAEPPVDTPNDIDSESPPDIETLMTPSFDDSSVDQELVDDSEPITPAVLSEIEDDELLWLTQDEFDELINDTGVGPETRAALSRRRHTLLAKLRSKQEGNFYNFEPEER